MANMFNEDGTYNKTEWKAGDKITAVKLNKIELSLEAINNNDIDRHYEADTRLDTLEARVTNLISEIDRVSIELTDIQAELNNLIKELNSIVILDIN